MEISEPGAETLHQAARHSGLIPIDELRTPTVGTLEAAAYLNRRPQTLRSWACLENGPLRPIRLHGRLAWPIAEIRRLLGVQ